MQKIARRKVADYIAKQLVAGEPLAHLVDQAAAYLVDNKRPQDVELLIRDIEASLSEHDVSVVHLASAQELTAEERASALELVREQQSTKHAVVSTETVDPNLIGGVIIRTSQSVFDGSIKARLAQLSRLATTTE